mmetsp:Transcript_3660/g.11317  ORF Transcript_3660/g.11317 Transcript_3660/m.11317 type:complete len:467 (-) Transcript_3660:231-1631(-)
MAWSSLSLSAFMCGMSGFCFRIESSFRWRSRQPSSLATSSARRCAFSSFSASFFFSSAAAAASSACCRRCWAASSGEMTLAEEASEEGVSARSCASFIFLALRAALLPWMMDSTRSSSSAASAAPQVQFCNFRDTMTWLRFNLERRAASWRWTMRASSASALALLTRSSVAPRSRRSSATRTLFSSVKRSRSLSTFANAARRRSAVAAALAAADLAARAAPSTTESPHASRDHSRWASSSEASSSATTSPFFFEEEEEKARSSWSRKVRSAVTAQLALASERAARSSTNFRVAVCASRCLRFASDSFSNLALSNSKANSARSARAEQIATSSSSADKRWPASSSISEGSGSSSSSPPSRRGDSLSTPPRMRVAAFRNLSRTCSPVMDLCGCTFLTGGGTEKTRTTNAEAFRTLSPNVPASSANRASRAATRAASAAAASHVATFSASTTSSSSECWLLSDDERHTK